jgi:hypothetical protein
MHSHGIAFCFLAIAATCAHGRAAVAADASVAAEASGTLSTVRTVSTEVMLETPTRTAPQRKHADFETEHASPNARHVADWIVDSDDNRDLPFAIVDKIDAKVFVFDAGGRLRGAAPALLGLARGDDAVPGIGNRKMSSIRPDERTTPAGRFVAAMDRNIHGKEILWVNYEDAISMHPVITTNARERRAQRLATATPLDNRISYGCINVPAGFFENVVRKAFTGTDGIVYVLPDTRSIREVFPSHARDEQARLRADIPSVTAQTPSFARQ